MLSIYVIVRLRVQVRPHQSNRSVLTINTVQGLSPIDLSHTTTLQQVLLFIQTFLGSSIFISWIVVMIRKYVPCFPGEQSPLTQSRNIMASQCAHWAEEQRSLRENAQNLLARVLSSKSRTVDERSRSNQTEQVSPTPRPRRDTVGVLKPFHKSSIRRLDTEPRMVNPVGRLSSRVASREPPPEIIYGASKEDSQQGQSISPEQISDSPKGTPEELVDAKTEDIKPENGTFTPVPAVNMAPPVRLTNLPPSISRRGEGAPRVVEFGLPSRRSTVEEISTAQPRIGSLRQRGPNASLPRTRTFTEIDISASFLSFAW